MIPMWSDSDEVDDSVIVGRRKKTNKEGIQILRDLDIRSKFLGHGVLHEGLRDGGVCTARSRFPILSCVQARLKRTLESSGEAFRAAL